jgi:hypothetical protein
MKTLKLPSGSTYSPDLVSQFFTRMGLPPPLFEKRFHPTREWRFDLAWPEERLALEVVGGLWMGGRHNTPEGYLSDMEKFNAAACLGWRILFTTPRGLSSFGTAAMVKEALSAK